MDIDKDFLPYIFSEDTIYVDLEGNLPADQPEAESPVTEKPKLTTTSKEETPAAEPTPSPKVLVLLEKQINSEEETLLNNILGAVNLEANDVERIYEHPAKYNELKQTKLILSFHSAYAPKGNYEINQAHAIKIIYAHDLSTLNANINYKKQLWMNLKKLSL